MTLRPIPEQTTNYRARFVSLLALPLLLMSVSLTSLSSAQSAPISQSAPTVPLPKSAQPTHIHHRASARKPDVVWRAAWQKKWIAGLEAQQKTALKPQSTQVNLKPTDAAGPHTLPTVAPAIRSSPAPTPMPSAQPVAKAHSAPTAAIKTPDTSVAASPASITNSVSTVGSISSAKTTPAAPPDFLTQTKPDVFVSNASGLGSTKSGDHTQDNPLAPVGDAWKMLAYLVPMLLIILVCLNLLKRFHARTGRFPGPLQASAHWAGKDRKEYAAPQARTSLLSALQKIFASNAHSQPASSIRLIESMPMGGASVHLLEVRGRVLLLGSSAGSLNLLAEFDAQAGGGSDEFRDLLHAAASDMDALDYVQPDLPAHSAVTTLEGLLRETGQAVSQRSRRLRTVREVEGEDA